MDILQVLIGKLEQLPPGAHSSGLKAVRLHIEVAIGHFKRAQGDEDERLFTDAIYRCNQALEGSLKEAYRVLASKDPEKITLAEVESFLTSSGVLRKRVLDQLTNYRREWRNASTHDYMLNFDEDEALLAIVSVTVFAIVLCDQIENKLAFIEARSTAPVTPLPEASLLDQVAEAVRRFAKRYHAGFAPGAARQRISYQAVQGGLAGYLSAEMSFLGAQVWEGGVGDLGADVVVESGHVAIAIELKLMVRLSQTSVGIAMNKLQAIVESNPFSGGILLTLVTGALGFSGVDYEIAGFNTGTLMGNKGIKLVSPH
jgi:hypothetical protein